MKAVYDDNKKVVALHLNLDEAGLIMGLMGSFGMGATATAKTTIVAACMPPEQLDEFFNKLHKFNDSMDDHDPKRRQAVNMFIQILQAVGKGMENLDAGIYVARE